MHKKSSGGATPYGLPEENGTGEPPARRRGRPEGLVTGSFPWTLAQMDVGSIMLVIEKNEFYRQTIAIAVRSVQKHIPRRRLRRHALLRLRPRLGSPFRFYEIRRTS
ncbi:hypothetical protein R75461_07229 [Paraburkholderia nemoris]|uniref:hypothetical protein n=1 Tax=Paraburkholderia nemoris TaxID=2793076 RepID=UPI001909EDA8|nr:MULTISPECIES: hypothetical protein [Paraburkholderia]MBK3787086.1 hypothetical protein [Paraburkholderia aspalathi]CAE6845439.1 hypothetical protein R75461_07229 [Paraburkholderia nemoris]